MTILTSRDLFLSTPSARRATRNGLYHDLYRENFYPRPPRGGRQYTRATWPNGNIFLSTPSARRATSDVRERAVEQSISIHALREEGDSAPAWRCSPHSHFYPRPPRGGRRQRARVALKPLGISIHALREEGDAPCGGYAIQSHAFLSTPSARRATFLPYSGG